MTTVYSGPTLASASTQDRGVIESSLGTPPVEKDQSSVDTTEVKPALGVPHAEKRFWFQRGKTYDPDAIATLVSISQLYPYFIQVLMFWTA